MKRFIRSLLRPPLSAALAALLLAVAFGGAFADSHGNDPTAITLRYFRAVGQPDGILLEWATGTELNTAGFLIERAPEEGGSYQTLDDIGFVPAAGSDLVGEEYSAFDATAAFGQTYWYMLVELETTGGVENEFGPAWATAGTTPTPTPIVITSPTPPAPTAPPTSTRLPTAAAATPTPTSSATALPSATLLPSATPLPSATATRTPISVSNNPTATPFIFPATETPSSATQAGVVFAQEESSPTPAPAEDSGYPAPAPAAVEGAPSLPAVPAYPEAGNERLNVPPSLPASPPLPAAGGPDAGSATLPPAPGQEPSALSTVERSTLILWGGFCAALLVLIAGIYAAILLYTRRPPQANKE